MTDKRCLQGIPARCGKTLSQHYCLDCETKLIRINETEWYCPNCDKKVKSMMRVI